MVTGRGLPPVSRSSLTRRSSLFFDPGSREIVVNPVTPGGNRRFNRARNP